LTTNAGQIDTSSAAVRLDHNNKIGIKFPDDAKGVAVKLIPLQDAKQFNLSGDVSIDLSKLNVGDYMLEMPATESISRCLLLDRFTVQCAREYETLNGEGICYAFSQTKLWTTLAIACLLIAFLAGLAVYTYKHRESAQALFTSVMKNEGIQGLHLGNEVIDFAGDAVMYYEVATRYRALQGVFMGYTIAFGLASFVFIFAFGLKLATLIAQLRSRRERLNTAALFRATSGQMLQEDRRSVLQERLTMCRKEQKNTYGAVLCATLEDLPMVPPPLPLNHANKHSPLYSSCQCTEFVMALAIAQGALSIALLSSLQTGDKLSLLNQLCIAYSWINLGGKLLKGTGLPGLWAQEKDILRKLAKYDAAALSEADGARDGKIMPNARSFREGSLERNPSHSAALESGPIQWVRNALNRNRQGNRQGRDPDFELVNAFVMQEQRYRAARACSNASARTAAAVLRDAMPDIPDSDRSG
jgi:hypothetical protein